MAAISTGLLALAFLVLGLSELPRRQSEASGLVAHTLEALGAVATLEADLTRTGSEARAFVLDRTADSKAGFEAAAGDADADLVTLRALTADDPVQQDALDRLGPLIGARAAALHEMVQRAEAGDPPGGQWSIRTQHARERMQQVLSVTEGMKAAERRLLVQRSDAARRALWWTLVGLLTSGVLAAASLLLAAALLTGRERQRKYLTHLGQVSAEQHRTRSLLDAVVENVPAMLFLKDARDLRLLLLNRAGEELLGIPRTEVLGNFDHDLFPEDQADLFVARDREVLRSGVMQVSEEMIQTPSNGPRLLLTRKLPIAGEDWQPRYLLGFSEDITDRRAAELRIAHMAYHDGLTDLPNRSAFRERLAEALARVRREGGGLAVLWLDLDHFQSVNDALGEQAGDALLQALAERLRTNIREVDTIARLGGDQFAILQIAPDSVPDAAAILARRLAELTAEPFEIGGRQASVAASIGIAIGPSDGGDPDSLLTNAELALRRARGSGRGAYRFFEAGMDARVQTRRALEHELRRGLERGEFELHYQPLVRLAAGRTVGVEALLRWRHPERGLVSPAEFIPVAEESGLIVPLGAWVLARACAEAASMPGDLLVAVNLSPVQFGRGDLIGAVEEALAASGLPASRLELEITESLLLQDNADTLVVLHRLRSLGVRIAMDDFGTGYSSLSYLRRFPFDKIKIDQSFVRDMVHDPGSLAIVRAAIELGTTLGVTTLAEGVETEEQLALLGAAACDEAQGYLFSRPRPIRELIECCLSNHIAQGEGAGFVGAL